MSRVRKAGSEHSFLATKRKAYSPAVRVVPATHSAQEVAVTSLCGKRRNRRSRTSANGIVSHCGSSSQRRNVGNSEAVRSAIKCIATVIAIRINHHTRHIFRNRSVDIEGITGGNSILLSRNSGTGRHNTPTKNASILVDETVTRSEDSRTVTNAGRNNSRIRQSRHSGNSDDVSHNTVTTIDGSKSINKRMDIRTSGHEIHNRILSSNIIMISICTASINVSSILKDRLGDHIDSIGGRTTVAVGNRHAERLRRISSDVVCRNNKLSSRGIDTISPNVRNKTGRDDTDGDFLIFTVEEVVRVASGPRSAIHHEVDNRQRVNTDIQGLDSLTTSENAGNFNRVSTAVNHISENLAGICSRKNHTSRTIVVPQIGELSVSSQSRRDISNQNTIGILTDTGRSKNVNIRSLIVVKTDNSRSRISTLGEHILHKHAISTSSQTGEGIVGGPGSTIIDRIFVSGSVRISIHNIVNGNRTIVERGVAELVRSGICIVSKVIRNMRNINESTRQRIVHTVVHSISDDDSVIANSNTGEDIFSLIGNTTIDRV